MSRSTHSGVAAARREHRSRPAAAETAQTGSPWSDDSARLGADFDVPRDLSSRLLGVGQSPEAQATQLIRRRYLELEPPSRLMAKLRDLPRQAACGYRLLPRLWRRPGLAVAASYVVAVGVVLAMGGPAPFDRAGERVSRTLAEKVILPTRALSRDLLWEAEVALSEGRALSLRLAATVPAAGESAQGWLRLGLEQQSSRLDAYRRNVAHQVGELGRRLGILDETVGAPEGNDSTTATRPSRPPEPDRTKGSASETRTLEPLSRRSASLV